MRRISRSFRAMESAPSSIPFPHQPAASVPASSRADDCADSPDGVLAAFADVSRRINDLARELKCLGHFDDDDDLPRAA